MTNSAMQLETLDEIWRTVAASLGPEWKWTRHNDAAAEAASESRGWLCDQGELRLCVRLKGSRWEIRAWLDARVPGTDELIGLRRLYEASEAQPVTAITVSRLRPVAAIAQDIGRRLLPSVRESLIRLNARRAERAALLARRQRAREAILRLVPSAYQAVSGTHDAPRLFLGPNIILDLRIDDDDGITITKWCGLDLDATLRLIEIALRRPHDNLCSYYPDG